MKKSSIDSRLARIEAQIELLIEAQKNLNKKMKPVKEMTQSEIILESLRYCRHRLSNKHPLSGMKRTGITFKDIERVIKSLTLK